MFGKYSHVSNKHPPFPQINYAKNDDPGHSCSTPLAY